MNLFLLLVYLSIYLFSNHLVHQVVVAVVVAGSILLLMRLKIFFILFGQNRPKPFFLLFLRAEPVCSSVCPLCHFVFRIVKNRTENIHLLCKAADLLFDCVWFSCFAYV